MKGLTIVSGTLFSLQSTTLCNGYSGAYGMFEWNGSAWTQPLSSACSPQFSGSSDGALFAIGVDTYVYESTNLGSAYTKLTALGTGWKWVSATDLTSAVGVRTLNLYSILVTSGTYTAMSNGQTLYPAASTNQGTYVVGDDGSGYVYHWDGSTWDKLLGSGFTQISSCGTGCVFAIGAGGQTYRLPDFSMTATVTLTGNTTCQPSPCPSNIVHSPHVGAKFAQQSMGGQVTNGPGGPPETQINIQAQDTTMDPFYCIEDGFDSSNCLVNGTNYSNAGDVDCSAFGIGLFTGVAVTGGSSSNWHQAMTRVDDGSSQTLVSHVNFQCGFNPVVVYEGPWNYWCDQGLNPNPPADYRFNVVSSCHTTGNPPSIDPNLWGFDTAGPCYYPVPGGSPLFCIYDPLPGGVGLGPLDYKRNLIAPSVTKNSKGKCTITGVTQ